MKIIKAEAYHISLPMKFVFKTSFGEIKQRDTIIVKLTTDNGQVGYGESAPLTEPVYLEESIGTCKHLIQDLLFPLILNKSLTPADFVQLTFHLRGNRIAKFGIETALWMIQSLSEQKNIKDLLGGVKQEIEIGENIGILPSIHQTLDLIQKRLDEGYKRIKLKISPGHDLELLKKVRTKFPNEPLMVDANSAYTLKDVELFKKLDQFYLMMIEQPLGFDDIIDHAQLQKHIKTPICLDESIISYEHARKAIEIGACRIINVKPGRIGSLVETSHINQLAKKNNIKLWCGGMIEAGIANAYNLYAASLSEFSLPADLSPSSQFFENYIIKPGIQMLKPGIVAVPENIGLGFEVDEEMITRHIVEKLVSKGLCLIFLSYPLIFSCLTSGFNSV